MALRNCSNKHVRRLGFIQKLYNIAIFSVASIFFGYVTVRIFFPLIDSKITPLSGLAAVFAFLAVFMILWAFDRFLTRKMTKKAVITAVVFLIAVNSALQALCFYYLEVKPSWDFGAIMGASEDIAAGRAISSWKYFEEYPYNLYPAVYIGVFRIILGGWRLAPYILNIFSVTTSIAGACFLAYSIYGQRAAVLTALFCLAVTPLYLYIPIVYTDTLSMPFPIWTACAWAYIHKDKTYACNQNVGKLRAGKLYPNKLHDGESHAGESHSGKLCVDKLYAGHAGRLHDGKRYIIIFCSLIGLLSAFGFLIKKVAAIGLVAFVVDYFFNREEYSILFRNTKNTLTKAISRAVPLAVTLFVFTATVYSAKACLEHIGYGGMLHSDRELPYAHWLMMGMNNTGSEGGGSTGYGGFNVADLRYSRSFMKNELIKQASISIIKERLSQFGIGGYAAFLLKKIEWTWTDGTYYVPVKLGRHPLKRTVLHKFVIFSDSKSSKLFLIFAQMVQAVILSMIFAGCVSSLAKGSDKAFRLMTAMCLGLAFFLLFWETRSRYLVFLIPVFIVMAVKGILTVFRGLDKAFKAFIM